MQRYEDRVDAGRQLGRLVAARIDGPAVVLAVPRAGVQVGAPVAAALHASLVPLLVRKVGLPESPHVVVGAIDADGAIVTARGLSKLGLLPAELEGLGEDVSSRLAAWRRAFGAPDPAEVLPGHVAVVVDDALVSGLTAIAGVEYLRRRRAGRIIVAVPAGRVDAIEALEKLGVEVVAPLRAPVGGDTAAFYKHLPEVTDEEVAHLLSRSGPTRSTELRGLPAERGLRLVDERLTPHKALFRLGDGHGPAAGMLLVGPGLEPGQPLGEKAAQRLAEAGIASLRVVLAGGADPARVVTLALDALSARPEVDSIRLGVVAVGEAAISAVAGIRGDLRVAAVALLGPPEGLELPSKALIVADPELDERGLDRVARWLGDRLWPAP